MGLTLRRTETLPDSDNTPARLPILPPPEYIWDSAFSLTMPGLPSSHAAVLYSLHGAAFGDKQEEGKALRRFGFCWGG